jgi:serine/threonine protein kinase
MEHVPMTLHKFLALHPQLKLPAKLSIISGLIKILRFLKRMEFSHSDIKADNILCNEKGDGLRLTDFGHACAWEARYGKDSVRDGSNQKLAPWSSSRYHISSRNGTTKSNASVDQFSVTMLIIQVLMGRSHAVFQTAAKFKRLSLDLKSLPSKEDQYIVPILQELRLCLEVEGAQLELHTLERVVASVRKGADNLLQ